jgi:hypothetical protein
MAQITSPGVPIDVSRAHAAPNYPNPPVVLSTSNLPVNVSRGHAAPNYTPGFQDGDSA